MICGGCQGADEIAASVGNELGFEVVVENARWTQFGKAAGPMRNKKMIEKALEMKNTHVGSSLKLIAFHDDLSSSKGTKHCINEALKKGVSIRIVTCLSSVDI